MPQQPNPQQPRKQPTGKKPGFNLTWVYFAVIAGLAIMLYQGNSGSAGGQKQEVDYSAFRAYVQKGYAREVVVDKSESEVRFVVQPQHIREVFKAGSDKVGTRPTVVAKYPTIDKVTDFLDKNYKGVVRYEESSNYFLQLLGSLLPILLLVFLWFYILKQVLHIVWQIKTATMQVCIIVTCL